ncbi:MAG: DUF2269 family protein [Dehalococcoidia bacterium]
MDEFDVYRLLLFFHIGAAVLGLGVTFAYPFLQSAAERSGTGAVRFTMQMFDRLDKLVVYPAAALIVAFGVGLIFSDVTGYSDDFPVFLMVAIPLFLVTWLLSLFVQRPIYLAALRTLDGVPDDAPLPEAYGPLGQRVQMVGGLMGLTIVVIIFLMVWKPGD